MKHEGKDTMEPLPQTVASGIAVAPPTVVALERFLEELRRISSGTITKQALCDLLQQFTVAPADLEPYYHWLPDRHTRNLIYRNDRIELMVLCWPVGMETPAHTHNGQLGWMAMVTGCLVVENYRFVACDKPENQQVVGIDCLAGATEIELERLSAETCMPGGPLNTVDKQQTIHRIRNPRERNERAVSLHIYSLPIDSCVVFDVEGQRCYRRELGYDNS